MREEFPHLKEWCSEHLWAPSCFHGSVGNGWNVVEKYIQTQDYTMQKTLYRPVLKYGVCDCNDRFFMLGEAIKSQKNFFLI